MESSPGAGRPVRGTPAAVVGLVALLLCSVPASATDVPGHAGTGRRSEAVLLERGEASVPLDDFSLYRVIASGGAPLRSFAFNPSADLFVPVGELPLVGAPLTPDSAVWLAFTVANSSGAGDWILYVAGQLERIEELVLVDKRGGVRRWSGERLANIVYSDGIPALHLPVLYLASRTAYVRLSGADPFRLSPVLVRPAAFADSMKHRSRLAGFSMGLALATALLTVYLLALGDGRPRYWYLPYLAAALAVVIVPGLVHAPEAYPGGHRHPDFLDAALVLLVALGLDAASLARLSGRDPNPLGMAVRIVAVAAALAFGAVGWTRSALLAAGLALLSASFMAIVRGARIVRRGADRKARIWFTFVPMVPGSLVFLAWTLDDGHVLPAWAPLMLPASIQAQIFLLAVGLAVRAIVLRGEEASERAELRERLGRAELWKDEFIESASGAIRAPLYSMLGLLDGLYERTPDATASSELSLIKAEATRLHNRVSNILGYLGIQDGAIPLASEPFNLAASIDAIVSLTRYLAAGRSVSMDLSVPIIEMRNDVKAMQQVLYNAVYRAVSGRGVTAVGISARSDVHIITIDVSDDGQPRPVSGNAAAPGVGGATDPDDYGVTARLSTLLGGSFARRRDGRLNVQSFVFPREMSFVQQGRPGEAAFGLALAAATSAPRVELDVPSSAAPSGFPGKTRGNALVVDDEPVSLFNLKRRLEGAGWRVEAVVSAVAALERVISGEPYDVAIVDSLMPEMSGYEFCERVRARHGPESLPLVIMMDSGRPEEIERAFRAGANDYLTKPVSAVELLARINTQAELAGAVRRELDHRARMAETDKLKTLGWLAAGVAHEINTPNNAVLRNVPILKELWESLGEPLMRSHAHEGDFSVKGFGYDDIMREIPEMLGDLYLGAQHIRKIVEDLKDYARTPTKDSEASPADVNQVVSYAIRLLKHSIAVATDRFELDAARDLPPVRGDRLKLTQLVVNIVENAIQALPGKDHGVFIRTFAEGPDWVCVSVRDEGCGMDEATLAAVFDPFFTTKRDRGGSGLGMPVALGIARELGGMIELRSIEGAGTTALLRIPATGKEAVDA